jgi:hypothetical protein
MHPTNGSVQDVKNKAPAYYSRCSWHDNISNRTEGFRQYSSRASFRHEYSPHPSFLLRVCALVKPRLSCVGALHDGRAKTLAQSLSKRNRVLSEFITLVDRPSLRIYLARRCLHSYVMLESKRI